MNRYTPLTLALLLAAACANAQPAVDPSSDGVAPRQTVAAPAVAKDPPLARPSAPATPLAKDVSSPPTATASAPVAAAGAAADTLKLERPSTALTAMDQSNDETDLKTTQRIRQAVMGDRTLGFTAKNVKIITRGGKVTLRGPVSSDQERASIEAAAKRIAGDTQVDDQIEIRE